jgi:dUTP pyrophosphatase
MKIKIYNGSTNDLPFYSTSGSAGVDLRAYLSLGVKEKFLNFAAFDKEGNWLTIFSGGRALVPTGLYMAIPDGYELQIRPRSGLALKHGITITNSPGTIDSDYRGEIGIIIQNLGEEPFVIENGDRICQAVLNKVEQAEWIEVEELEDLDETERGAGGFNSTGTK